MSSSVWAGQLLAGRYEIHDRLGAGGAAEVYQAYDRNLGREVAVKMIHAHLAREAGFLARFAREAHAVAGLRHPNIIQVFDFNTEDGTAFMVMEYLPGRTLHSRLKELTDRGATLPLAEAIRIFTAVGNALDYAHSRGMIHRDVKSGNILFDGRNEPILTDFGLAKMLGGETFTPSGALMGTAPYMSPERARGHGGDARSDVYSLGILLFEMATGRYPFVGASAASVMLMHLNDAPPNPHSINPHVSQPLAEALLVALAKEPAARYQTAGAFVAAIQSAAQSTTPRPRPSARVEKTLLEASTPFATVPRAALKPAVSASPGRTNLESLSSPAPAAPTPPRSTLHAAQRPSTSTRPFPWFLLALGGGGIVIALIAVVLALVFAIPETPNDLPDAEGMVKVPAGSYLLGASGEADSNHVPARRVELPEFWIDRYEVTNAQYATFIQQTGGEAPYSWQNGTYPAGQDRRPVRGVTYDEAAAYCAASGKQLPTEAEWEAAARGPEGRLYPWGDDPDAAALDAADTYPVGSVAANQSPSGVYDLAGNVWEWVRDPYEPVPSGDQVLRGGAYNYPQDMAYRLIGQPAVPTMIVDAGLRCAAGRVQGE